MRLRRAYSHTTGLYCCNTCSQNRCRQIFMGVDCSNYCGTQHPRTKIQRPRAKTQNTGSITNLCACRLCIAHITGAPKTQDVRPMDQDPKAESQEPMPKVQDRDQALQACTAAITETHNRETASTGLYRFNANKQQARQVCTDLAG